MAINHQITPCVRLSVTLDKCPLTFGIAPCGAVFDGTKGKCYNTFATCQALPDYQLGVEGRVYKFCSAGVFLAGYAPTIMAYNVSPPAIKSDYKLWQRERITVRLADSPGTDKEEDDDYQAERGGGLANASPRVNRASSWWARMIRRNRFFNRRQATFEVGYVDVGGVFHTTSTHHLYIDNMERSTQGGYVKIDITDGIKLKKDDDAVIPDESNLELSDDLDEAATEIEISENVAERFDGVRHISVGAEIMEVEQVVVEPDITKLLVLRARGGSEAKSHDAGSTVELCHTIENRNIVDVVRDVLVDFCDIGKAQIDDAGFNEERDGALQSYVCNAIIPKPTGADKILEELQQSGLFNVWFDSGENLIRLRSIVSLSALTGGIPELTDGDIMDRTLDITEEPRKSISRVLVYTNPVNFANVKKDNDKWSNLGVAVNATVEAEQARGEAVAAVVYSRFINSTIGFNMAQRYLLTGTLASSKIKLDLPISDTGRTVQIGDNIPLRSRHYVDADGNPEEYVFRVLEIISKGATHLTVRGVRTVFGSNGFRPFIWGESHWGDGGVWI